MDTANCAISQDVFDSLLTKAAKDLHSVQLTLPFPSAWPPESNETVVVYAYHKGSAGSGGRARFPVSSPCAKIELSVRSNTEPPFTIKTMSSQPLSQSETLASDVREKDSAQALLFNSLLNHQLPDLPSSEKITVVYKLWISQHAALFNEIKQYHQSFFRWIEER
ncbi:MAG TPA: hypothetical protein VHO70_00390 [Chitinispirillaceae bacterium]|nr:hypothetical protein [Chitinispirillaceae bacterium]